MHESKGEKSIINKRRNCRTLVYCSTYLRRFILYIFLYRILLYASAFLYRISATNISNINNSR